MSLFQHVITEEEQDMRIDLVIREHIPNESRSQIQKWIEESRVTVNDKIVKSNYRCQAGDKLIFKRPEVDIIQLEPEAIDLDIVYEDSDLLVVNKPRGMIVHPTEDQQTGTLVNALLHHTKELSKIGGAERPGIVHRLDKDTAGLLVIAKNDDVHTDLVNQFKDKTVNRVYEAIVHGSIPHEKGIIDAPIGRNPNNRLQMDVVDKGKEAITHFQVLERFDDFSSITCKLETGRTHQIRVHMNYIGHPLVGDPKYAPHQDELKAIGQALYAKKLGFIHPGTKKAIEFEIDRPPYFKDVLVKIKELEGNY